jgi:hypothetical protein
MKHIQEDSEVNSNLSQNTEGDYLCPMNYEGSQVYNRQGNCQCVE